MGASLPNSIVFENQKKFDIAGMILHTVRQSGTASRDDINNSIISMLIDSGQPYYPDEAEVIFNKLETEGYIYNTITHNRDGSLIKSTTTENNDDLKSGMTSTPRPYLHYSSYGITELGIEWLDEVTCSSTPEPKAYVGVIKGVRAAIYTAITLGLMFLIGLGWGLMIIGGFLFYIGHAEKVDLGIGSFKAAGNVGIVLFLTGIVIQLMISYPGIID